MTKEKLECRNCGSDQLVKEMVPGSAGGTNSFLRCTVCGHLEERQTIVLIAEIDISKKPRSEIEVVTMTGDPWVDFGYYLEVCGFLLKQASDITGKSVDELVKYSADYLKRAAEDYTVDMK
jgi:uncharacterized Zn finger protein